MRLLRVYIDGYRNLKNVTVDFDKDSLTTVVIGENGSGKSNLIEAIVEIFRAWDLRRPNELKFSYRIEYVIAADFVTLNSPGMMSSLNPHYMQLGSHFIPDQPWATRQSISQIGNLDTQRSTIGEVPVEFFARSRFRILLRKWATIGAVV